ncbi:50S ribosomal protein L4 [Hydrogenovibrio sp. JE_KL2]|uniref:50S ribosomal protein L4 n=1 Tax=Hydrogenovibrio sp. JE_KL2 TaxID=2651188 RepID=UPI00128E6285|nr:50S ribosomal protein L4 [Hydrogenovibrio sp. JE_KL2]MBD3820912.1 50S ribosomal protein L4 [Thiotrichales bacterium]MBN2606432.1 50S ribosomal protein L4 [Thiotrichales bacterium]MPQ77406.1 50S ribosomal protein L4 [Hydrogenovibrio sp. JE_KL2]
MDLKLIELSSGKETGALSVSDSVFGVEFNEPLVHQVVTAYMAGARSGTKGQKNRSAVSGGGAKPWAQKGSGRARAGTSRSPVWIGGGRAFPGHNRDFSQKVNKKMYRGAMRSIFSELARSGRLVVVDDFKVDAPKTKEFNAKLASLKIKDALVVTEGFDEYLYLSCRNLYNADVCDVNSLDPVSLVGFQSVVVTQAAVKQIEENLG